MSINLCDVSNGTGLNEWNHGDSSSLLEAVLSFAVGLFLILQELWFIALVHLHIVLLGSMSDALSLVLANFTLIDLCASCVLNE